MHMSYEADRRLRQLEKKYDNLNPDVAHLNATESFRPVNRVTLLLLILPTLLSLLTLPNLPTLPLLHLFNIVLTLPNTFLQTLDNFEVHAIRRKIRSEQTTT
jgi:hypothetical protein